MPKQQYKGNRAKNNPKPTIDDMCEVNNMKCKVKNCQRESYVRGLCNAHYKQLLRNGKVFKVTKREPNPVIDKGTHYEIVMYNTKYEETGRALIDKDDKNINTLDNRKANLRNCTHAQNLRNAKIRTDNTTGFKGVSFHSKWGWQAWIQVEKKRKHLGWFNTKDEAVKSRKDAEKIYYGKYAYRG
jgi:hypothetical protein